MRFCLVGDNSIANLTLQGQKLLAISSDSAKLDVEILLSLVLKKARSYLLTWPEKKLSDEQLLAFIALLSRRAQGEPIAYITGEKEFWSLPFAVSQATLIPRPDTETLVELVLELYSDDKCISCLDLGTGTGAIALALASEKATWEIEAIDFNIDAVNLAQRNANNLNLAQVKIYQSDWFTEIAKNKKFNIIVSNPPYIDGDDINLSQGDVRFEPKSALVATEQGLADIKYIANEARHFLSADGKLFFEHGFEQGHAVRTILTDLGYENAQTKEDLNGHERISWGLHPSVNLHNKLIITKK
ncbi:MAG: peptide chain release factor N(5)-glutamine methyltransferase [Colwellia sp.]|nr:peptide chain release factor N(5)-glutamine methyltransferase [Colwellia sp.]